MDDGSQAQAGVKEEERSAPRRANGIVAAVLVVFFLCAHSLLGSLSLALPLSNHFAWLVWAVTAVIIVHIVLSAVVTREKLSNPEKPPTTKKKLKMGLRWATGILIAVLVCVHAGSVVLFGSSAVQSTQVGKASVIALIVLVAVHVCTGVKSLVRDLGASKEQKDKLKTPMRLAVCLFAVILLALVLVFSS